MTSPARPQFTDDRRLREWYWDDAAHSFELPANWQDDRPLKTGTAMDALNTVIRDDAFRVSTGEDGECTLEVHIADIGSFMDNELDLLDHAEEKLFTRYRNGKQTQTLWPERISNNIFSLTDRAEKPVMTIKMPISDDPGMLPEIEFGRLRPEVISPGDFDSKLRSQDPESHRLYQLARQLYLLRTGRYPEEQNPHEAELSSEVKVYPARFTLREFMTYANIGLTRFIRSHHVPSINLTDQPGEAVFAEGSEALRAVQNRKLGRYTVEHLSYKEQPSYARGTSPLIDFDSFANMANTSAALRGEPFVFSAKRLQGIARRMTRLQHTRIANGIIQDELDAEKMKT
jgi:hypothetical protein